METILNKRKSLSNGVAVYGMQKNE